MMIPTIQRVSDLEISYVMDVLHNQFRNSNAGDFSRRLEQKFAETFGAKYAIAQVNGTATLHSALVAAGVGPGDEVIVPPLTMMSTTFAVLHAGAVPVYADVRSDTFTVDPKNIESCLTEKTKAIITVALYGLSPDMDPIMEIAKRKRLCVIEDNAQCFLGYYKGKVAGSIGHFASYSFQMSKHLTCGEGGMLITSDEDLAEKARRFGTLGYASIGASSEKGRVSKDVIQDPGYERHMMVGWNYRMAEPVAAIALAQTERMKELVLQREKIAALYAQAHAGCRWLTPQAVPAEFKHAWWTYPLKLETRGGFGWREFRKKYMELGGDGIYAAWMVNYLEPAIRGQSTLRQKFEPGLCPVAESLQSQLMQFTTNDLDLNIAEKKAEAMANTIRFFEG